MRRRGRRLARLVAASLVAGWLSTVAPVMGGLVTAAPGMAGLRAGPAAAQTGVGPTTTCVEGAQAPGASSCPSTSTDAGVLPAVVPPQPAGAGQPADSGSVDFGTIVFVGLVWSLLPTVIAVSVASRRGLNVGMGALLGLIFGWVGLLVFLGLKPPAPGHEQPVAATSEPPGPAPPSSDPGARLRSLKRLRSEGLITEEEYSERRKEILSQI